MTNVTAFVPGTKVFVGENRNVEGVILAVKFMGKQLLPLYEVGWYNAGSHQDEWLSETEFSAVAEAKQTFGFGAAAERK